jgi:2-dehydropantoate 2-reductase
MGFRCCVDPSRQTGAMRFVVYGAGAVGGLVGARLVLSGHEVVLIARGEHAAVMQRDGLRLVDPGGSVVVRPPVVTHPRDVGLGADDVVLLAVKSDATVDALIELASCADANTPILCLQNGVANEPAAQRWFENVYGVCVMCPTTHLEPGVVVARCLPIVGLLDVGRFPGGTDDITAGASVAFEAAGFESRELDDVMRWKYAKLLLNLGNAVEAVCGRDARFGEIARMAREEGEAVLRLAGIEFVSAEEEAARRRGRLRRPPFDGAPDDGGSSWQSLARGTGRIETDYLAGEIVRLGRWHGVATPVNELLQVLARGAAVSGAAPGAVSETAVLDALAGG